VYDGVSVGTKYVSVCTDGVSVGTEDVNVCTNGVSVCRTVLVQEQKMLVYVRMVLV